MPSEEAREARARRALAKGGFRMFKTPARSWRRAEHGVGYMIVDTSTNTVVSGCIGRLYSDCLDDVETFLSAPRS
ncbi:hypothetical protein K9U40_03760 [Xanthobacter autotrophicus]|uniref:hypothetical protein n=1 Tax=Xanthobacter TaxID=279 RepID=UPI0024AAD067|nr:hypothetical protein [Xanthobacter autotrophicus]MDI4663456.1 hypothetical protein [Xanthobacter autotrophicus]